MRRVGMQWQFLGVQASSEQLTDVNGSRCGSRSVIHVFNAAENAAQLPIPVNSENKHSIATLEDPAPLTYAV